MSKLWKGLKKAFKVVLKVVKAVAIVVVIAAAVYFTAGAAANAFGFLAGATSGTAFGSFAAGAQTFFNAISTQALSYIKGLGTLWKNGVQAFTGQAAGTTAGTAAQSTLNTSLIGTAGQNAAQMTAAEVAARGAGGAIEGALTNAAVNTTTIGAGDGLLGKIGSSLKDMSATDKLLLAKTGVDVVGGLTAPTEREKVEAQRGFVGSFYGRSADGSGGGVVDIGGGGAQTVFQPEVARPAPTAQSLFDARTSVATNPDGKIFDPKRAATQPLDLFPGMQPAGA